MQRVPGQLSDDKYFPAFKLLLHFCADHRILHTKSKLVADFSTGESRAELQRGVRNLRVPYLTWYLILAPLSFGYASERFNFIHILVQIPVIKTFHITNL